MKMKQRCVVVEKGEENVEKTNASAAQTPEM